MCLCTRDVNGSPLTWLTSVWEQPPDAGRGPLQFHEGWGPAALHLGGLQAADPTSHQPLTHELVGGCCQAGAVPHGILLNQLTG